MSYWAEPGYQPTVVQWNEVETLAKGSAGDHGESAMRAESRSYETLVGQISPENMMESGVGRILGGIAPSMIESFRFQFDVSHMWKWQLLSVGQHVGHLVAVWSPV